MNVEKVQIEWDTVLQTVLEMLILVGFRVGLFFSGANGWRLKEIVHVKDLIDELMTDTN